jgi:hypothetical protein
MGNLYSDTFNTTLSMIPTGGGSLPAVSDELLEGVATAVETWFNAGLVSPWTGIGITSRATLTGIKLNRIGTDGRYVDAETKEHTYPSPVPGGWSGTNVAPQLTLALTLRGSNERARAGRGRMYLPPSVSISALGADGRLTVTDALNVAKGGLFLLGAVNDVYLTEGVNAVAGIASKQASGAFQGVAQVSVGRVVDTIRSRRNKQDEDPQFWGAP